MQICATFQSAVIVITVALAVCLLLLRCWMQARTPADQLAISAALTSGYAGKCRVQMSRAHGQQRRRHLALPSALLMRCASHEQQYRCVACSAAYSGALRIWVVMPLAHGSMPSAGW